MEFSRGHPGPGQLAGELLRTVLGPGEDQYPLVAAGQGGDNRHPVGRRDGQQMVDDLGRRGGAVDGVPGRAVQETPREDVHRPVQGGGEQQSLPFRRSGVKQPPYDRQEPQVGHVVRFVDHADLDIAEVAVVLLDEVGQPPRAGDDDIGAVAQGRHLRALRGTAENGGDAQPHGPRQRRQDRDDLGGQLTGGHQHQAARAARHRVAVGQPGHEGDAEPERLARPGLGPAENVEAGQRIGQHRGLHGKWHRNAVSGERGYQRGRDAEISEGGPAGGHRDGFFCGQD